MPKTNSKVGQDNHGVDPLRVFSTSRADIDSDHFDHLLLLTEDFEILVFEEQDIEPLRHFRPHILFAVRWQTKFTSNSGLHSRTNALTRAAIAQWMAEFPADGSKWQELLGHAMPTEENASTEPPTHPETSDTADLQTLDNARDSANTNADKAFTSSVVKLHHTEESGAAAAAETPSSPSVASVGTKDNIVDGIVPRKYRSLVKAVLFPFFLLLCAEMLQWGWSIMLSSLRSRAAFDTDFAAHTIIMETQAEVQFVYGILFSVLAILYLTAW